MPWALRGGGGAVAAVTAIELALMPITEVVAGAMFWPLERATEILGAWRRWTREVPDEVSSCGRLLRLPPLPEIPEPLRGGSFVVIESVHTGVHDAASAGNRHTQGASSSRQP